MLGTRETVNQLHVVEPASLEAKDHAIQARQSDGVDARKVARHLVRAVARRTIPRDSAWSNWATAEIRGGAIGAGSCVGRRRGRVASGAPVSGRFGSPR